MRSGRTAPLGMLHPRSSSTPIRTGLAWHRSQLRWRWCNKWGKGSGIYVLLQRQGSRDFFWKARMVDLDRDECKIDIHHIFPRDWCDGQKIDPIIYNAIVNKTPISYKANRMI